MNIAPILVIAFILIFVYAGSAVHRLAMNDRQLVRQNDGAQRLKSADWWGIRWTGFAVVFGLVALGVFFVKLMHAV